MELLMLRDVEALDCPICTEALTVPIFQCGNGHIACSTCCDKLCNKCPFCTLPISHIRNRAMERIITNVTVPCPNVKLGCTKSFSYGKELSTHVKECVFSPCSYPAKDCNYTSSYKDLHSHFDIHKGGGGIRKTIYRFGFGRFTKIYFFHLTECSSIVMEQEKYGLLFVVKCFKEPHGVYVTVSFIAPCAKEVGEFSCDISLMERYTVMTKFSKIKKIRKVSSETPKEDFMFVPSCDLCGRQSLRLRICISKLNQA